MLARSKSVTVSSGFFNRKFDLISCRTSGVAVALCEIFMSLRQNLKKKV